MKLPNAALAIVEQDKITEYLLNHAHPDNGGKAAFFLTQGFNRDEWEVLAAAFRKQAQTADVAEAVESSHGQKYILDGGMETPSGKIPRVRTVWIVDRGLDVPRLITAYPRQE